MSTTLQNTNTNSSLNTGLFAQIKIYWNIAKFNFLKYLIYPTETIAIITDSIIGFLLLIFFWSMFSGSTGQNTSINQLISYFLLSGAINTLTFAKQFKFGRNIQKAIKNGEISNYMIKPLNLIPYLFSNLFIGKNGMNILVALAYLILGIIVKFPPSWANLPVFILYYFVALSISLGLNILIATVQFYTTEAGSIKNVFSHITTFLSGAMIPIYLIPDNIRKVVEFLPFASMIYGPIKSLTQPITNQIFIEIGIAIIWAVLINFIALFVWKKSIKSYDAVGI